MIVDKASGMKRSSRGTLVSPMVSCIAPVSSSQADLNIELAHNLESAHNSAHEFYFSSIAEEYLVRFTSLLQQTEGGATGALATR